MKGISNIYCIKIPFSATYGQKPFFNLTKQKKKIFAIVKIKIAHGWFDDLAVL